MDRSGIVVTGAANMLLRDAVLCCAVLCCAVLCCAVLCCAVLCCAVLCSAVLAAQAVRDNEIMMCLKKGSSIWVRDPISR